MKIGVIFCAFNAGDLLPRSLAPWTEARGQKLDGHQFVIAAVCVPFEKFEEPRLDSTLEELRKELAAYKIDRLIGATSPAKETDARGAALRHLVEAGCDVTIQVDHDEIYDLQTISRIFHFVQSRPSIVCFKGSLKNYVFDEQTFLVQPFNPMRIHRVRAGDFTAHWFWDDNNVSYIRDGTNELRRDIDFACLTIPRSIGWTAHYSWLNNERSKRKVEYQKKRWGTSSFDWDAKNNVLIWRAGHEQETETE